MTSTPYWQDAFATQPLFATWVKRPYAKPVFIMVKNGHGHNHRPKPTRPSTLLPRAAAQALAENAAATTLCAIALRDAARARAWQLLQQAAHQWPLRKHDGRAEAALLAVYSARQLSRTTTVTAILQTGGKY